MDTGVGVCGELNSIFWGMSGIFLTLQGLLDTFNESDRSRGRSMFVFTVKGKVVRVVGLLDREQTEDDFRCPRVFIRHLVMTKD